MTKDKSSAKPHENSYTLVIVVSFVIAVLMPFARAIATGDTQVAAAAYVNSTSAPAAHAALPAGSGADELSLLVVGAFLLGLGSLLRRVA